MSIVEVMIAVALAAVAAVLLDIAVAGDGAMSPIEVVGLALLVVLASYLFYRCFRRTRHLERTWRIPPEPKVWTGKGFDASGISPKIARVRENYLAEKQAPSSHFHRSLLVFAREAVSRFGFFHDRNHTEAHNTGEQPH